LADVLRDIDAYPTPKGVSAQTWTMLTAELKRLLIARAGGSKTISTAPTGLANAVSDLAAASNPAGTLATVAWTEKLAGDYNNDGVVDITDLQPLALYYMERTDTGPDDAHRLVNGDDNPEINIADLGAIAQNYMAKVEGYQVWRGSFNGTSTDWEATFRPNISNPTNTSFSSDRPSPPPVSARPPFTYTDDISALADKTIVRYKVVPFGDGVGGVESNEATMPPPTYFSVSGTVTESGVGLAGVLMTLTPGGLNATTQADGTYTITGVADGSYTLTPSKTGYGFTPPTRSVSVSGADVIGKDFTALQSGLANSAWPKFRGNAQNTGLSPYVGAQTNTLKWTRQTGDCVFSSPAIGADGTVYVGSTDGNVYALNPADGSVKWSFATGGSVLSSPAIGADGTVYFGGDDGYVYALNPADGSVKWSHATGGSVLSSPAIGADGTVYIGSNDHNVYALNPSDGSVKWSYATGGAVESSPAIGADGTVYVGSDDAKLYALNPIDGSVKWTYLTGDWVRSSPAIGADGTVYVVSWDRNIYALNPSDASVKWSYTTGGGVNSSPAIGADGTVYVGSDKLYALNAADGSVKWTHTVSCPESLPAIGADGTVYIGSWDGKVYALNPPYGSVKWYFTTGDYVSSSPAIGADGTVYIGSRDNNVYAFGP
jgi:outer membrane protein assembly factor BamB